MTGKRELKKGRQFLARKNGLREHWRATKDSKGKSKTGKF